MEFALGFLDLEEKNNDFIRFLSLHILIFYYCY